MLRRLISPLVLIAILASSGHAEVWTEEFFGFQRTAHEAVTLPETPIWEEYGFEEGERAVYTKDGVSFTVTAWRFDNSTSAMAVYQWQLPLDYGPSELPEALAVESDDSLYMALGNYILHFEGRKPSVEELQGLSLVLPMSEHSTLPFLPQYLPRENLQAGTERFIIGPAGLQQFEPRIPLSVAAFQYGTEAQIGRFQTPAGAFDLAIFSYPTPHIARERLVEFRMLENAVVKRTGPMVVVALDPPDPEEAQSLLGRVNYRATITWEELFPDKQWTMADLILTAAAFVGVLAGFALLGGLGFAGIHILRRRMVAGTTAADPMTMLHLEDK